MTHVIIQHLRSKPGYISSIGFFTCVMGFNFYYAPKIENPQTRYACAGVSATLFQEILMHSIDTLNMKAKALDGSKSLTLTLIKKEGLFSLYRGIQPVLYGYIFSSFIYFQIYASMKHKMKNDIYNQNSTDKTDTEIQDSKSKAIFYKTMFVAFFSSMIAELVCLVFYYPFDLIKTRMQVDQAFYGYRGTLDAFIKIYNEKKYLEYNKFLQKTLKFTNFFKGMFLYSLTYTTYVAFSFSLFESFLLSIENFREEQKLKRFQDRIQRLQDENKTLNKDQQTKLKEEYGILEGKKSIEHSRVDIVLASFTSGCIAGLITNPIEYLAVKKQIDENFSMKKVFQRKGIVYDMLCRGNLLRSTYNGLSSITFFLFFQELCLPMNVDITMYDE